jgi:hypothetical protein
LPHQGFERFDILPILYHSLSVCVLRILFKWSSRAPGWRNGQYFTARRPEVSVNENIFMMNADGTGVTTFTTAPGVSAEAAVR